MPRAILSTSKRDKDYRWLWGRFPERQALQSWQVGLGVLGWEKTRHDAWTRQCTPRSQCTCSSGRARLAQKTLHLSFTSSSEQRFGRELEQAVETLAVSSMTR